MLAVLDDFLVGCDQRRPHRGRTMNGGTPAKAFVDGLRETTNRKEDKKPARKVT